MPAPIPYPTLKRDTRFYKDDIDFLDRYLQDRNLRFTDIARELIHEYANRKRAQVGMRPAQPYPPTPGTIP